MLANVGWKWRVEQFQHATGFSMSKSSPREAFAERGHVSPHNAMECEILQKLLAAPAKFEQNSRPNQLIERSCLSLGSTSFRLKLSRCCLLMVPEGRGHHRGDALRNPQARCTHNLLCAKHFHEVPSASPHAYSLKSRYGK